jgi:putative flavoprotein involved in K+ transport
MACGLSTGAAQPRTVVVGGGAAGLATAACLGRAGVDALVLESASQLGEQWRGRYDRLHLHTARVLSGLPGLALPRASGQWVPRDQMAAYLQRYAEHHGLDVRTGVTVTGVQRVAGGGWRVVTSAGNVEAPFVVMATGHDRVARLPAWSGMDRFRGRVLHSSEYRDPAPFIDQTVLVVGCGNSGSEIAVDLVEGGAGRVLLSVRTPPNIIPRDLFGVPVQFPGVLLSYLPTWLGDPLVRAVQRLLIPDLRTQGLRRPRRGVATQFASGGTIPVLDVGLVEAVRSGAVTPVAAIDGFSEEAVVLGDGSRLAADAVIAATGYQRGLEDLVGALDVLDDRGLPRAYGGTTLPNARNLHFVGYHPTIGGHLREIGREALRVARTIAGDLAAPPGRHAVRAGARAMARRPGPPSARPARRRAAAAPPRRGRGR